MVRGTASSIADKAAKNASNAVDSYRLGVQNPKADPVDQAVKQKTKLKANLVKRIDDGTWEKNLRAVGSSAIKAAAASKGADRYSGGVEAAKPKIVDFFSKQIPLLEAAQAQIRAMPSTTDEENKARMIKNYELMKATKGKAKGG